MAREKIDWAEHFTISGVDLREVDYSDEGMRLFIESASSQLEALYLPQEAKDRVTAAGYSLRGTSYFRDLFSEDSNVSQADKVTSAFVGAVAHGREAIASEAYELLAAYTGGGAEFNATLTGRLSRAMRQERWHGSYQRLERLEGAAKALGMPLHRRALGGLATSFAMHSR